MKPQRADDTLLQRYIPSALSWHPYGAMPTRQNSVQDVDSSWPAIGVPLGSFRERGCCRCRQTTLPLPAFPGPRRCPLVGIDIVSPAKGLVLVVGSIAQTSQAGHPLGRSDESVTPPASSLSIPVPQRGSS